MLKVDISAHSNLNVQGIAFTEIICEDIEPIAKALELLGFVPFRRHRNKPIMLYKAETSYIMIHQTSIIVDSAIGVIVENVDKLLRAAERLTKSEYIEFEVHTSGPTGPMGLHIPALRFVNGHYFYLIERGEIDTFFAFDFITF